MNNKVLVTGGAGFIGAHTVVELINSEYEPIIIDNLSNSHEFVLGKLSQLCGREIKFYKVDCCNKSELDEVFKIEKTIEKVIHFAAFKAVGESVEKSLKYYKNNLISLINILDCTEEYQVKSLVFSSSCTVYGQADELPVTENTPTNQPDSPYGNTKKVSEEIIRDHSKNSKTNFVALRYFNPIGAHPSSLIGELPIGKPNNLVPFITQTGAGLRDELTVFGNDYNTEDGTCIRDYIHVVDLAKAHIAALKYEAEENNYSVFNIGTGKGNSVLEVIKTFEEISNQSLNYKFGPRRSGDIEAVYSDTTLSKKELNWSTELTLEDALRDAWNWQKTLK